MMARTVLLLVWALSMPLAASIVAEAPAAERWAPWFTVEPGSVDSTGSTGVGGVGGVLRYLAGSGVVVRCAAAGRPAPRLDWLDGDAPLHSVPGVRRVHSNGTLEVLGGARGPATVRCRAANPHGVALSNELTLVPVEESGWEVRLEAGRAAAGGVAALACRSDSDLVRPTRWYFGDRALPLREDRYLMAVNMLLIRDARASDSGDYSCVGRHDLTALTKRSPPARLTVTEGEWSGAGELSVASARAGEVAAGGALCLPCAAPHHPQPLYTWYRSRGGRLEPLSESAEGEVRTWAWAGGAALCVARAGAAAAGGWACRAAGTAGRATVHTHLTVRGALTLTVRPTLLVVASGSTVQLNCSANAGPAARLWWAHDGARLQAGPVLALRAVARHHRGLYQCFGARGPDHAHADAELRLGESAPELQYTFIEQALRPGAAVTLRCAAAGAPPPRFLWLRDGQPLESHHRYTIRSEVTAAGDVWSALNISAAAPPDGGRYSCRALNSRGTAEHSARLNIYGPPAVRAGGAVRVLAGSNATLYCPYAGYPISSITWRAPGGGAVPAAGRVSAAGDQLRLRPALPPDAGHYACAVAGAAAAGGLAAADLEIQVRNPPKISPFMFSSDLTEGSSAQVLCGVSSGDKPMYFSWFKDGDPLPPDLQIEEKSLNEFSLLMFSGLSARHSGAYTCRVANQAAAANYTAALAVNVAPTWETEPRDTAVLLGAPLLVECAARGHPPPTVAWRPAGAGGDGEAGGDGGAGAVETGVEGKGGAKLHAAAAARAHAGLYRCEADNGVAAPLSKLVRLTVHEPPHFDEPDGANVTIVRGQTATLICHALGDPPLTVYWTHMGTRVDLNSYRWTATEAKTAEGVRSELRVRAAARADAGPYRCHAANRHGHAASLTRLLVLEPPEAPQSVRLGGLGARWARLAWRVASAIAAADVRYSAAFTSLHALAGDSKLTVVNLTLEDSSVDRLQEDGSRMLSARLESIRPATAYSLKIVASNRVGQSPPSEPLLFTTLEEPPTAAPQNVRVKAVDEDELHVTWSAPPQDGWNGELLGYVVSWREVARAPLPEDALGEEAGGGGGDGAGVGGAGWVWAGGWRATAAVLELRRSAQYVVRVCAYNRAGAGPPAPAPPAVAGAGLSDLEAVPREVSCAAAGAREVSVRWAPARAPPYDVLYAPLLYLPSWGREVEGVGGVVRGGPVSAVVGGLSAGTNYSVRVRARAAPPSAPARCAPPATGVAVPAPVAVGAGAGRVRVAWRPPAGPRPDHYTLYAREVARAGGEWSQRVESPPAVGGVGGAAPVEVWREVGGLRDGAPHEFWVVASSASSASPRVTATPHEPAGARAASPGGAVRAVRGARVSLPCAAVGAPPLRRRWSPHPPAPARALDADGALLLNAVEMSGNYTCTVSNAGGSESVTYAVSVAGPPGAPAAPRLERARRAALAVRWAAPPAPPAAPVLGYTLRWATDTPAGGEERSARLSVGSVTPASADGGARWVVRGLACGAPYALTVQAHSAAGDSPRSPPLRVATRPDEGGAEAEAAAGALVWTNSSALRVNLATWPAAACGAGPAAQLRAAPRAAWADLPTDADGLAAQANNLQPGTWYEIRVLTRSPTGVTSTLYRAATLTLNGERLGEPVAVEGSARGRVGEVGSVGGTGVVGGGGVGGGSTGVAGGVWRSALPPLLLAAALAALLALAAVVVARRRAPRAAPPPAVASCGKTLDPPDGDLAEISPYATFSMPPSGAGAGGETRGCSLRLHTFGRGAAGLSLAAPPPPPGPRTPHHELERARDSDSESSGSPCAACAADLYRRPVVAAAAAADTLPMTESSAEDTYGRRPPVTRRARPPADRSDLSDRYGRNDRYERSERSGRYERGERDDRGRRRRDHARLTAPTVRYFTPLQPPRPRQEAL